MGIPFRDTPIFINLGMHSVVRVWFICTATLEGVEKDGTTPADQCQFTLWESSSKTRPGSGCFTTVLSELGMAKGCPLLRHTVGQSRHLMVDIMIRQHGAMLPSLQTCCRQALVPCCRGPLLPNPPEKNKDPSVSTLVHMNKEHKNNLPDPSCHLQIWFGSVGVGALNANHGDGKEEEFSGVAPAYPLAAASRSMRDGGGRPGDGEGDGGRRQRLWKEWGEQRRKWFESFWTQKCLAALAWETGETRLGPGIGAELLWGDEGGVNECTTTIRLFLSSKDHHI